MHARLAELDELKRRVAELESVSTLPSASSRDRAKENGYSLRER